MAEAFFTGLQRVVGISDLEKGYRDREDYLFKYKSAFLPQYKFDFRMKILSNPVWSTQWLKATREANMEFDRMLWAALADSNEWDYDLVPICDGAGLFI